MILNIAVLLEGLKLVQRSDSGGGYVHLKAEDPLPEPPDMSNRRVIHYRRLGSCEAVALVEVDGERFWRWRNEARTVDVPEKTFGSLDEAVGRSLIKWRENRIVR